MCHGGFFERALVPERLHTHTCAALGLRASAPPESAPPNGHDANISTARGVQHSLSDEGIYHNIEKAIGMSFTICRASFVCVQT